MSKYNCVIKPITDDYNDNFFSDEPRRGLTRDDYALFVEDYSKALDIITLLIWHDDVSPTPFDGPYRAERYTDASACNGAGIDGYFIRFKTSEIDAVSAAISDAVKA
ncbi:hypothetical protein [Sphingomonas sp. CFBP 13706]|uniref:hypothetical protein n=1 Tax=Sphingomonas sp. CFBP 13706 TaxID=2775314 RepID=UPI00177B7A31|nr:hypothetical protein [Sphingomonas sp. CFBP 13706]MBD8734911.1 hypothetical protein [Sphingomonas sp. CFBP 13706]